VHNIPQIAYNTMMQSQKIIKSSFKSNHPIIDDKKLFIYTKEMCWVKPFKMWK